MKLTDRITGIFLVLLGLATFVGGSHLPPVHGQQIGPSVFPMVIGAGLMLVGALIALHIGRSFEEAAETELAEHHSLPDTEAERYAASRLPVAFLPPAMLVFYYFVSEWLGFVPTAAIMIGVIAYAFDANRKTILPAAILGAIFIQIVFVKLLRVPLAPGLLPMPW